VTTRDRALARALAAIIIAIAFALFVMDLLGLLGGTA
jgi:hypothetical protein